MLRLGFEVPGQGVFPLLVMKVSGFDFKKLEECPPMKNDDGCGMWTLRFGLGQVCERTTT